MSLGSHADPSPRFPPSGDRQGAEAIARLQRQMLPARLPSPRGYEFAVYYQPCEAAGGDFYGFQEFDDGRLGFAVADVAGHGAAAAVMMAVLRSAMAAFRVFGRVRESVAQDVNAVINDIDIPSIFVTAFFVSLDCESGRIYCGNCGHPPPVIVRYGGQVEEVVGSASVPLGILPEVDPGMISQQLERGDALVLYTDGITEARNAAGTEFGMDGLQAAMTRYPHTSAHELRDAVIRAVHAHENGLRPVDDQCVLVCRRLM